jgi:hypothetical protein
VLLVVIFGLSAATYRYVETPFRQGVRWRRPRRALLLYPASLVTVIALAAAGRNYIDHQLGNTGHNPAISIADFKGHNLSHDHQVALVEASVLAAQQGQAVPSHLTPAVLGLRKDTASLGACDYRTGTTKLCAGGDPTARRSIVVFGDSHARAWAPGINELGRLAGYRVYTLVYSGCSVSSLTQIDTATGRPWGACQAFKSWAMDTIASLHPDYVVVSSRGATPVVTSDGTRVGAGLGDRPAFLAATATGVADVLSTLRQDAGHVVVVGDTPLLPREPGVCLSSGHGVNLGDCLFTRTASAHRVQQRFAQAARSSGATYVDAMPWFCAHALCPSVVGQMITMRDKEHVTPEYATLLARRLGDRIGVVTPRSAG